MGVLSKLFQVYVGIIFFGTYIFLIFPLQYLALRFWGEKGHVFAHRCNVLWGRILFTGMFLRIKTQGLERLTPGKQYIFVSNHRTYLDIPVVHVAIPVFFRFLGKIELTKAPLFGYMFRRVHIAVDRGSRMGTAKSMALSRKALRNGDNLFIFPEGTTRQKSLHELGPVQAGAFALAVQQKTEIVPVTLLNASKALDRKFHARPFVRIDVIIDEPVDGAAYSTENFEAFQQQIVSTINSRLRAHYLPQPAKV